MALGLVVLATLTTKWLTAPPRDWLCGEISPLLFAAVMVSAWFGGTGPGLVATALAGFASVFFFIDYPAGSGTFGAGDVLRVCMFLMVALLISFLAVMRRRAETALRKSLEELEQRVQHRTAELKISNDRLRESEERFRLLVEGVADYAIVMLDSTGKVISWNSGAERIHGYGPEQIIGRHFGCFFPREEMTQEKPGHHLQEAAVHERHEDEGWRIKKDGAPFWASVITTCLRDERGQLRGFAQVTRDITEFRRLEREVLDISEQEQRRLGHDLHDGLGQELTGLAFEPKPRA
jgi:PAS domain S-box-containing protein